MELALSHPTYVKPSYLESTDVASIFCPALPGARRT
jgi:hypothetical protein